MTNKIKPIIYKNTRLNHEYYVEKQIECGMALNKSQISLIKDFWVSFLGTFAFIKNNELFLTNYKSSKEIEKEIKLLVSRKEIIEINKFLNDKDNSTLITHSIYRSGNYLKVNLAYCYGKKQYDKRQDILQKEYERNVKNDL